MSIPRVCAVALAGTFLLAACSSSDSTPDASTPEAPSGSAAQIVVSTSILGDIVGDIAECAGGTVSVLMPPGTDPHDFAPSSEQVAQMVTADMVVVNGLGLEPGLDGAVETATADGATVLDVGSRLEPLVAEDGSTDPHFWLDMARTSKAAALIGDELSAVTGESTYAQCGSDVSAAIAAAGAEVATTLASVPAEKRVLVTDHESLGYLADAYGYRIIGTVIPAATTLAEPSSAELAELAAAIRAAGVPAIFADSNQPTELSQAVAAEAGTDVAIVPLYVESLGAPGSAASTYIGLMTENARLIAEALGT